MIQDPLPRVKQSAPWPVITDETVEMKKLDGPRIKVRCIDPRGLYYEYLRRREGDVFYLTPKEVTVVDMNTGKPVMENGKPKMKIVTAKEQLSQTTMEVVEDETPENITTAQQALNKVQDELNEAKSPARGRR